MLQYFKKQEKIYPRRVTGFFRNLKWAVLIVTLGIYYFVPFLRWDRGPHAPDQAVLIDLYGPRAYFFGIEIWPQEVFILTGILILAALALFAVTSLFGRVWCGYLCPQTVWTDLFVWVERLVQGDRNKRKRLHEGPWSFEKVWKIAITHLIWLFIGFCTGGAFVLYFNDAPGLLSDLYHLEASSTVVTFIAGLTVSTYIMAGFAREQVCTYMCPYARFQSAMFDKDTLVIGYDEKRGEPRGKHKMGESWEGRGDCISCSMCVQVCPMGIDIRDGLQMECIACGLCVDACDQVMDRVGLPRGLVRYDTENHMQAIEKGGEERFKFFRLRTLYYAVIMSIVGGLMLYALIVRSPLEMHVLHDRNPLFVQLSSGEIRNGYTIKILNKTHEIKHYALTIEGLEGAVLDVKGTDSITQDNLYVAADSVGKYHVFVRHDMLPDEPKDVVFVLRDKDTGLEKRYDARFITKRERR